MGGSQQGGGGGLWGGKYGPAQPGGGGSLPPGVKPVNMGGVWGNAPADGLPKPPTDPSLGLPGWNPNTNSWMSVPAASMVGGPRPMGAPMAGAIPGGAAPLQGGVNAGLPGGGLQGGPSQAPPALARMFGGQQPPQGMGQMPGENTFQSLSAIGRR